MSENPIMQYKKKLNTLSLLMVLLAVLHLLAAVLGFASGKLDQALMIAASAVSAVTAVLMFIMGLNGLKQVRGKTGSRTHLALTWVALVCSVAVIVLQIAGGAASWLAIAVAAVSCVLAPVFAKAAGDLYQRRAAREDCSLLRNWNHRGCTAGQCCPFVWDPAEKACNWPRKPIP